MEINVFTDGSCRSNGRISAVGGIGIYFPNNEFNNVSDKFVLSPITNQRAELYAIQKAIEIIKIGSAFRKITIYSDSLYAINSLTKWVKLWEKNNWKTCGNKCVKNLDLIQPIHKLIKEYNGSIIFRHVKAHSMNTGFEPDGNKKADELATNASNIRVIF